MKNIILSLLILGVSSASAQNSNIILNRPDSSQVGQSGTVNFTASTKLGSYSSAGEATLISGLGVSDAGSVWWNTTLNSLGLWTGSKVVRYGMFDFGNGSSGVVTITGTTTLTTDAYYSNLTINSGGILITRGVRVFVNGLLTVNAGGIVHADGTNGASSSSQTGGISGSGIPTVFIGGSASSGGGATGVAGVGVQAGGITNSGNCGGNAGNGGAGGSGASGAGGASRVQNKTSRLIQHATYEYRVGTSMLLGGASGPGGSSGAGDGTNLGRGGGAGGVGAGIVAIYAREIINNGTIRANGGNGGNGASGTVGNIGGGGGGGGAGGGCVYLYYTEYSGSGVIEVNGGTGGTGGTGFGTGTAGNNGGNGIAGNIYRYNVVTQTWE